MHNHGDGSSYFIPDLEIEGSVGRHEAREKCAVVPGGDYGGHLFNRGRSIGAASVPSGMDENRHEGV